jgi:predicted ATPase
LRLNDAIVQVLRAAAELRPTVVVIDDAQWADEATLELLRFLARSRGQARLQICVTYRDDEGGAAQSLAELAGSRVEHIPLRRLPPESTTDLVRSMLGLEQLPTLLMEQVQRTTKGNAFFVQELIRSLAEDGIVLQRTVEGWQVDRAALQDARLPESIRQVAWRRLAHLSAETREVLCWAAVVGPMFWDGVLQKIGQVSRERVQIALDEGLERELIFERVTSAFTGEREFLFAKPAVQEVGCESISQEERREVHGRAAVWLMARRDEEVSEHLGLIADHLESAGQTEQAVIYLRRAGEQAAAQFANVEAAAYFSRALDLMPVDELDRRYDLLLEREKVYGLQGAREAQREDLAALEKLARVLGDDRRRAEVALRQADYAEATADYPTAIAAARAAIHLGQTTQDASIEAAGYLRWGWAFWRQGKYKAAQSKLERALALAQAAGARKAEAYSLLNLGVTSIDQDNLVRATACYEQALHICCEIGDRRGEDWAFNDLGIISLHQGDYDEARAYWEQALRIAREIGDRRNEAIKLCNLGKVFADQGDYAGARVYYEQSLRLKREIDDRGGTSLVLANLGLLFYHLGDNEAAREYSQRALLIAQEIGGRRIEGAAWMNLGHALVDLGRLTEATDAYQKALALWRELGQPNLATEPLAGLARISLTQGDLTQAQAYVEEILRYLDQGKSLRGVEEPLRVYLTCCRVLRANRDPRAETILDTTHRLLQERAAKIEDEKLRRSFLEDVSAHREIAREAASLYQ